MTSYRTTMREALAIMNEDNLEKMRKAAAGAMQTLKMKDGSIGVDSFTASAIMQIYDKINDKNKKTFENMMKNGKKADIVKLMKFAMSKVNAEYVPEEFELDEEKDPRQLVNPNKEIMVVKKNKVIVIDKKDKDKYMKQGWSLAEEVDLDEAKYTYKAATFNGNTVVGTGSTEEDAIKDAKNKAKELGSTLRKRISMKKEGVDLDEAKMYAIGYHFLHGLKNQNMKKSKDFKTKKEAEKAANDIVRAKGGRAEVYANMFDPSGRPGHQDYPKLLKTIKEEADLDEEKMSASQIAALKKAYEPMRGKKISMDSGNKLSSIMDRVDDDKETLSQLVKADIPFVSQLAVTRLITKHGMKGAEIRKMQEEVELDEAKYDLYHKDFSTAMQHAYAMAKKMYGITVDPKEIDDKVASGPRKPSEGKTNSYRLKGDKGAIQVQVYNKGGSKPFELNMYKEEVELDEAVKVGDTVKVKLNRKGKEYIEKGKVIKIEKDSIIVKHDFSRTPSKVSMKNIVKEEVDLDEGKMSQLHQYIKDKKSPEEIAKLMKLDVKTIKALMSSHHPEEVEEGAAADARRAMRGDPDMRQRAFSKDDSATDDERKAASKNIMMQMRKAVSLRSFDVEFADGKKVKIPQKVAQAVLQKYNSFRKPADKEKYQAKVGKSYKDMLATLKEGFASDAQRRAAFAQGYKAKGKKDKKESTLERMNKKIQEKKNG